MYLLPPDTIVGQQHPKDGTHPQDHVGFGKDCTHKPHSQLHAVEELTTYCGTKWMGEEQARDLAGGN